MSIESLPVPRLVLLALAEGFLTPEQAMETCLAYGQSIEESKPFEVERFWLRFRWLTPTQIEHLASLHNGWLLFQAPRTRIEDTAVLMSIQQLLQRQHETPQSPYNWSYAPPAGPLDTTDDFSFSELTGVSELPASEEETEADTDDGSEAAERHTLRPDERPFVKQRSFEVDDTEAFLMPDMTQLVALSEQARASLVGNRSFEVDATVAVLPDEEDTSNSNRGDDAEALATSDEFETPIDPGVEHEAKLPPHPTGALPSKTVPSLRDAFAMRYESRGSSPDGDPRSFHVERTGIDYIYDRNLERVVMRKMLVPSDKYVLQNAGHFVLQMRMLGQLNHPNIPKVYDLLLHKRFMYAMMPLLPTSTLTQKLAAGKLRFHEQLRILRCLCEAVVHAHEQGVLHRCITPDNVLLGDDGDIFLVGWSPPLASSEEVPREELRLMLSRDDDVIAHLQSDPRYMAPEWLSHGVIGPHVDQYALGVLMYRCLTGSYPFLGVDTFALLYQINSLSLTRPHLRAPERHIPDELAAICMRMLSREPEKRFDSMRDVLVALDNYEASTFAVENRQHIANALYAEARLLAEQYTELLAHARELRETWEEQSAKLVPWASLEEKSPVWEQEARATKAEKEASTLLGAATQKFLRALEQAPQHGASRQGLAHLFWQRFLEAERREDLRGQRFSLDMVRLYDDGALVALLEEEASISLLLPSSSTWSIERFEEKHKRLQSVDVLDGEETPQALSLPPGSYVLHCQYEQDEDEGLLHLPFAITRDVACRGEEVVLDARALAAHPLPGAGPANSIRGFEDSGFCLIQGGSFELGGDREAPGAVPRSTATIDSFWMSRGPVTFGEYISFLNAIHLESPTQARAIVPRVEGREAFVKLNAEGRYVPNRKTLFAGPIASRYPSHEHQEWFLPVYGISWFDAVKFCRWRSSQLGRLVTLPTEQQWERAAMGADRRLYPWGNAFDPSFCKMGLSRESHERVPEPLGAFPIDRSPFGIWDLAGGVRDWTLGTVGDEEVAAEMERSSQQTQLQLVARGGCWRDLDALSLRIGARRLMAADARSREVGFRLVVSCDLSTREVS